MAWGWRSAPRPDASTRSRPIWCICSRRRSLSVYAPGHARPDLRRRNADPAIPGFPVPGLAEARRARFMSRRARPGFAAGSSNPASSGYKARGHLTGALHLVPACPDNRLRPVAGASAVAGARPKLLPHPHVSASARYARLARAERGLSQAFSRGAPCCSSTRLLEPCPVPSAAAPVAVEESERTISINRILSIGFLA